MSTSKPRSEVTVDSWVDLVAEEERPAGGEEAATTTSGVSAALVRALTTVAPRRPPRLIPRRRTPMSKHERTSTSAAHRVTAEDADRPTQARESGISPTPPSSAASPPSPGALPLLVAVRAARRAGVAFVRRYHRLEITTTDLPDGPVLFVTNHGFGGAADLNVLAALAALDESGSTREVTILCHQIAWPLRLGKIVEAGGARPATYESATEAFRVGHHVPVAPGGDIEEAKSFTDCNKIVFSGRRGFARLAAENACPSCPS